MACALLRDPGDAEALERALRAGADDAIRSYILRERAHLLACYEMETLVGLVRAALAGRADSGPELEAFGPLR